MQSHVGTGISLLCIAHAETVQLRDKLGRTSMALGKHGAEPEHTEAQYSRELGHETSI